MLTLKDKLTGLGLGARLRRHTVEQRRASLYEVFATEVARLSSDVDAQGLPLRRIRS